jgi:hypothetical protein
MDPYTNYYLNNINLNFLPNKSKSQRRSNDFRFFNFIISRQSCGDAKMFLALSQNFFRGNL